MRFVSPALRSDQRALTVEAIAPNTDGRLKPGPVRDGADSAGRRRRRRSLVPEAAVETVSGTSRVYVVKDGKAEERIVTLGEKVDGQIELTSGVAKGETIARGRAARTQSADGMAVRSK